MYLSMPASSASMLPEGTQGPDGYRERGLGTSGVSTDPLWRGTCQAANLAPQRSRHKQSQANQLY
jgi:hypothetical protein